MKNNYYITQDAEACMKKLSLVGKEDIAESLNDFRLGMNNALMEAFKNLDGFRLKTVKYETIKNIFELWRSSESNQIWIDDVFKREYDVGASLTRTYASLKQVESMTSSEILTRQGSSLTKEIERLVDMLQSKGISEIEIFDDGIVSGSTMNNIINQLNSKVKVKKINVIMDFSDNKLTQKISSVICESKDSLIDWIDERDWIVGMPLSGASVKEENGDIYGVPYCRNSAIAQRRAAIPEEGSKTFSRKLLKLNQQFWAGVGESRGKDVLVSDLPRVEKLFARSGCSKNDKMVDALEKILSL